MKQKEKHDDGLLRHSLACRREELRRTHEAHALELAHVRQQAEASGRALTQLREGLQVAITKWRENATIHRRAASYTRRDSPTSTYPLADSAFARSFELCADQLAALLTAADQPQKAEVDKTTRDA